MDSTSYPYTSSTIYQQLSVQQQYNYQPAPAQCFCRNEELIKSVDPSQRIESNGKVGVFYDAYCCGASCDINLSTFLPGAPGSYSV